MGSILLIEDERNARYALKRVLEDAGFSVVDVEDPKEAKNPDSFSLLILDLKLKNLSGIDFLQELRERGINVPVIVITAYANPENIISASRYGVVDILKKPFEREELLELVERVLEEKESSGEPQRYSEGVIVGESKKMVEVFKKVGMAASTDMNVLLVGETGVGKDMLAKVIHEKSHRKEGPFIAINCSAIPENLLEAELFGYRKGAFTGATRDIRGKIELAEGGTLFLDEIGDMPLPLQAKLLRFLETKSFYRLGEERERSSNVRVIAATNRNLRKMIEEGNFREDLYYRLSQILIEIPPLRERKEDIPILIEMFIDRANKEFGTSVKGVSKVALEEAISYEWKGNVRELKNVVYKTVLETKGGYIEKFIFDQECRENVEELLNRCMSMLSEEEYKEFLARAEKSLLRYLLDKYEGNKSKVANLLGISRNTLRMKLKTLGL
ncbi:two component Fis family sigma54 specific transcriptional regulator [Hydrogenivirga caldilitoris]|uniref:Two component Fis family sigma54 specific transcriptional regulator n=1 Tax=Hydrogenivirga caldilitoris TaxID=246264 RepID=A0A497XQY2_9AQUI|nr:sigma-54 dependent transcriptional regulator [Hydrogenivirga caldilitoris]RLJ70549.1 two component Fis family sigma54 specific transcriptional regulator [Hydrogenivirga caldilitoris]